MTKPLRDGASFLTTILLPFSQPLFISGLLEIAKTGDGLAWEYFQKGVERLWLYQAPADGPSAALIRFQPRGRVPLHEHIGYEHIFVLSGSQKDEHGLAVAGTLIVNPPGTRHRIVSKTGCIVLAIYEKPVKFIE